MAARTTDDIAADQVRRAAADQRDDTAAAREKALSERELDLDILFAAAELRDARTHIRDLEADRRDKVAVLDATLHGVDDRAGTADRMLAKKDRIHSEQDRIEAEVDRYALADLEPRDVEDDGQSHSSTPASASQLEGDLDRALREPHDGVPSLASGDELAARRRLQHR